MFLEQQSDELPRVQASRGGLENDEIAIPTGQDRPGGDGAVHDAAEAAGADSVIAALPHGLITSLARSWWGGHDLSGGHWQRVAVAPALHRDAPVLVMDEPTAALDARAEHRIYTRLKTPEPFPTSV